MIISRAYREVFDRCGLVASAMCLIHCALTPVVISAIPAVKIYFSGTEWLHAALVLVAVSLGGCALLLGKLHHRKKLQTTVAAVGISLLLASLAEDQLGVVAEISAILGALSMAILHVKNIQAAQACCSAQNKNGAGFNGTRAASYSAIERKIQ